MELTLKIPKHLIFRLRPHEGQLDKILELGLDALEAADQIASTFPSGEFPEDDIPESWREAASSLSKGLEASSTLPAPNSVELTAYLQGDLDETEAETLRQRLLEHPQALEDLLVMEDPRFEADHLVMDDDGELAAGEMRQAWEELQVRLAARHNEGLEGQMSEAQASEQPPLAAETPDAASFKEELRQEPSPRVVPMPARVSRVRPWLSLAAGVLLTTLGYAASSTYHGQQIAAPRITHDIELNISRGTRTFAVGNEVEQVMLRIPRPPVTADGAQPRILEIFAPDGASILRREIEGWAQGGNSLHVLLPREKLTSGEHLLVVRDPQSDSKEPPWEYPFALEWP